MKGIIKTKIGLVLSVVFMLLLVIVTAAVNDHFTELNRPISIRIDEVVYPTPQA